MIVHQVVEMDSGATVYTCARCGAELDRVTMLEAVRIPIFRVGDLRLTLSDIIGARVRRAARVHRCGGRR